MTRILSGVQPTGNLHLGNYLGAIKNWVTMQHQHESLFCIVDLHAITVPQNPDSLRQATLSTAAAYIACGIDAEKSIIFHQSAIRQHTELCWLLSTLTPLGWLNRMTQFKEKTRQNELHEASDIALQNIQNANLGLYAYPVLMAADILLYHTTHVPVGEDQKQHLELARDIAGAFNRQYKKHTAKPYFRLPEPMIIGQATRVMSLRDGTSKMSKSDESDYSRINLTDSADLITQKIKKAKTDAEPGINFNTAKRPEISNLINIFSSINNESRDAITTRYSTANMSQFKNDLADALIAHLAPITKEIAKISEDKAYLEAILHSGAAKARLIAEENIKQIKKIMGFLQG